jgi:hypothetical protein
MPILSFLQPTPGRELFEVFFDGRSVGLVWKEASVWYADPNGTANPLITAGDKDEAVEGLLEEQGLEPPT